MAADNERTGSATRGQLGAVVIRRGHNAPRLVFGLAIIAAGVLFTLDNLHVTEAERFIDYWPVLVILFGAAHLAQNRSHGGFIWSMVLMFAGSWMLAYNLGYVDVDIWKLSPLLLVALGLSILWRAWSSPPAAACCPPAAEGSTNGPASLSVLSGTATSADDFIKGTAVMGAFERRSESQNYRGGDLVAIMAGAKLDLRHATIAGDEAVMDVLVIMGGVELRIPENWTVQVSVTPFLGGVTDQTRRPARGEPTKRLVLRGTVFMGGVEIKD